MSETVISPEVQTAEKVIEIVEDAYPMKLEDQQAKEQLRKTMLATMTEMEEARERIGQYCVTIGEGKTRAVLLLEPQTLTEHSKSVVLADYWLKSDKTHKLYVFATQDGFKALNYTTAIDNQAVIKDDEDLSTAPITPEEIAAIKQKDKERAAKGANQESKMLSLLNQAIDGKLPDEVKYEIGFYDKLDPKAYAKHDIDERRDPCCFGFIRIVQYVTDGFFVIEALRSSIDSVEKRHLASLTQANRAIYAAKAVGEAVREAV